ncbi:hypothetical protein SNEBB_001976 [Seison nebaliae]|nr:hypothetical protein SNEBB_001976 [Seison nebaliae]
MGKAKKPGLAQPHDESVKVIVRCRPMNEREIKLKSDNIVKMNKPQCSLINNKAPNAPPKTFSYDAVYDTDSITETIYAEVGFSLVDSVCEGYNGTIFAYGQTGSGKSFTMQGVPKPRTQRGLIPRSFAQIFDTVDTSSDSTTFLIRSSYIEIYNEDIHDLLGEDVKSKLELKENPDKGIYVKNLSWIECQSIEDCELLMSKGWDNRSVGATLMNADSSRSHSIFTVVMETMEFHNKKEMIRVGKLNLVDLAGSERQSKTQATGIRFKEATKINLSLSALGNVISALVDGKSKHIPYRDSKLTRLLQDSLGGGTKTVMVACISPSDNNYDETLSTLRYANRAKNIKNKPKINEDPKDAMIRQYLDEITKLREQLETGVGIIDVETMKKKDEELKQTKDAANRMQKKNKKKMQELQSQVKEEKKRKIISMLMGMTMKQEKEKTEKHERTNIRKNQHMTMVNDEGLKEEVKFTLTTDTGEDIPIHVITNEDETHPTIYLDKMNKDGEMEKLYLLSTPTKLKSDNTEQLFTFADDPERPNESHELAFALNHGDENSNFKIVSSKTDGKRLISTKLKDADGSTHNVQLNILRQDEAKPEDEHIMELTTSDGVVRTVGVKVTASDGNALTVESTKIVNGKDILVLKDTNGQSINMEILPKTKNPAKLAVSDEQGNRKRMNLQAKSRSTNQALAVQHVTPNGTVVLLSAGGKPTEATVDLTDNVTINALGQGPVKILKIRQEGNQRKMTIMQNGKPIEIDVVGSELLEMGKKTVNEVRIQMIKDGHKLDVASIDTRGKKHYLKMIDGGLEKIYTVPTIKDNEKLEKLAAKNAYGDLKDIYYIGLDGRAEEIQSLHRIAEFANDITVVQAPNRVRYHVTYGDESQIKVSAGSVDYPLLLRNSQDQHWKIQQIKLRSDNSMILIGQRTDTRAIEPLQLNGVQLVLVGENQQKTRFILAHPSGEFYKISRVVIDEINGQHKILITDSYERSRLIIANRPAGDNKNLQFNDRGKTHQMIIEGFDSDRYYVRDLAVDFRKQVIKYVKQTDHSEHTATIANPLQFIVTNLATNSREALACILGTHMHKVAAINFTENQKSITLVGGNNKPMMYKLLVQPAPFYLSDDQQNTNIFNVRIGLESLDTYSVCDIKWEHGHPILIYLSPDKTLKPIQTTNLSTAVLGGVDSQTGEQRHIGLVDVRGAMLPITNLEPGSVSAKTSSGNYIHYFIKTVSNPRGNMVLRDEAGNVAEFRLREKNGNFIKLDSIGSRGEKIVAIVEGKKVEKEIEPIENPLPVLDDVGKEHGIQFRTIDGEKLNLRVNEDEKAEFFDKQGYARIPKRPEDITDLQSNKVREKLTVVLPNGELAEYEMDVPKELANLPEFGKYRFKSARNPDAALLSSGEKLFTKGEMKEILQHRINQLTENRLQGGKKAHNKELAEKIQKERERAEEFRKLAEQTKEEQKKRNDVLSREFANTKEEVKVKTEMLKLEINQRKQLEMELSDAAFEFNEQKGQLLETIRNQERNMLLLAEILERIQPVINRTSNYYDIDLIKKQATWDDDAKEWSLPALRVEQTALPQLGRASAEQHQFNKRYDAGEARSVRNDVIRRHRPRTAFKNSRFEDGVVTGKVNGWMNDDVSESSNIVTGGRGSSRSAKRPQTGKLRPVKF